MTDIKNTDWDGVRPVQRTNDGGYISAWMIVLLTIALALILASSLFVWVTVWNAAHSLPWGFIAAAAWDAARDAAGAAANAAARAAAWDAARSAAKAAARDVAWDAARSAARSAQNNKLEQMVREAHEAQK